MTPETRKILTEAADLIDEYGWSLGEYEDESGALCAVGAITCAADGSGITDPDASPAVLAVRVACHELAEALDLDYDDGSAVESITGWNDTWGGHPDNDVATVLRHAVAGIEA